MNSWKELLVVVTGVALLCLLGAALPQSSSAADKSRNCADNLRQIIQVAALYQADYDGAFQPVITRTKPSWTYWYSKLTAYAKNPRIFYCPSNPKAERILAREEGENDLLPPIFDPLSVSYGMNFCLSSSGDPKASLSPGNIRRIANPAYTIYFGDSRGASLRPTKWCWNEDYAPVHEDAANFGFIDGHVAPMNQKNLGLLHEFNGWTRDVRRWSNWKKGE